MEKVNYQIMINTDPDTVYRVMLNKKTYSEWTSVFNPGSRYEGNWETGSKILFLGTGKDGDIEGMVSRIRQNTAGKFVSIEHLGLYHNGREIFDGDDVKEWAGSLEEYSFEEKNGKTRLSVYVDVNEKWRDYFSQTWPLALARLKEICES